MKRLDNCKFAFVRGLISIVILFTLSSQASASSLTSTDWLDPDLTWLTPGNNFLTYDPISGLEWLDFFHTDGASYNDVLNIMLPGEALEGFRFATLGEINTLFSHAGIDVPALSNGFVNVSNSEVTGLMGLIGTTDNTYYFEHSTGMFADTAGASFYSLFYDYAGYAKIFEGVTPGGAQGYNFDIGSWVVRDAQPFSPVPLPGAAWLFISGLLLLTRVKKSKTT